MSFFSTHYRDGQALHAGDLFHDGARLALVVVSLDRGEALPGHEHWVSSLHLEGHQGGFLFLIMQGPVFYDTTDEDQVLIARGRSDLSLPEGEKRKEG